MRAFLPHAREAALAGAFGLLVAAGMLTPGVVDCALAKGDSACEGAPSSWGLAWLGHAAWIWCLWLLASVSQCWLPRAEDKRPLWLGLQILALTLFFPVIGRWLGQTDGSLLPHSAYDLQVQASFAAVACLAVEFGQRRRRGEAEAHSLHHGTRALDRQLDEARAALLQAQVEPHFLFNTLAHLRLLARTEPRAARAMLADLRRYLAAALPGLRQTEAPLLRELELVRAFLALHQRRMGPDRLKLGYEVAAGLDHVIVPSTCLLTLAENAVKHGITPRLGGGEITVRAQPDPEDPGLLRLEVADTGAGMSATSGSGTGLVTLRARLAAVHGAAARLSLHMNQPSGLVARVQLPWR